MSQGSAYQTRQGQGSNTTSGDYHDYISRLSKMPSIIHGAPQYPSVHKAFNNKVTREEEVNEARQDSVTKKNPTRSTKKVRVKEQVQVIDQNGNRKPEDIEEDVDDEADGFIKQKKRGFELSKWKTFKYPQAREHVGCVQIIGKLDPSCCVNQHRYLNKMPVFLVLAELLSGLFGIACQENFSILSFN